jgi:hypothetical protein
MWYQFALKVLTPLSLSFDLYMGLTFKVGCDKVSFLGGGPRGPGDEARVRLSVECMEGFAEFRRGFRACLDRSRWYVLTTNRVVPMGFAPLAKQVKPSA